MLAAATAGVPHQIQVTPPQPQQAGGSFDDLLSKAIDDLHTLAGLADDPVDKQDVLKCLAALNGIKAAEQKEQDAAMGGKVSPRQMRKAYGN